MELKVLNAQGQAAGTLSAPATVFGRDYNEALVHQLVVAYQANLRWWPGRRGGGLRVGGNRR